VLELHPDAELVGIGVSAQMLAADSADVAAAYLRVSCLYDSLPQGDFDLVVSALAVHHLDGAGTSDLFVPGRRPAPAGRTVRAWRRGGTTRSGRRCDTNRRRARPAEHLGDQVRWLAAAGLDTELPGCAKTLP
jgi:tRNA (cmo5U34)-methyltransferase